MLLIIIIILIITITTTIPITKKSVWGVTTACL